MGCYENMYAKGACRTHWARYTRYKSIIERLDFSCENNLQDKVELDYKIEAVKTLLDKLPSRLRRIIKYRFGIDTGKALELEFVAKHFHVTRERVRQLEAKALRIMRRAAGGLNDL